MIIPSGYSQVNLKYTGTALINGAEMTFGVINGTGGSPTAVEGIVYTAWNTHLKSLFTNDTVLDSILVKNGPNISGPFVQVSHGTVPSGTGLVVPGQVCALVRKVTASGGRKGRGRMYMPGVFTGMLNADMSTIASATITAMNTAYLNFLVALQTATTDMYLLHADATAPTQVTDLLVQSAVATQRRRIRR